MNENQRKGFVMVVRVTLKMESSTSCRGNRQDDEEATPNDYECETNIQAQSGFFAMANELDRRRVNITSTSKWARGRR